MHGSRPILIAYDGSEGAKAAIVAAGRLFEGQRAVVLSVWHSAAAAAPATVIGMPTGMAAQAYQQLDEEAERQGRAAADEGVEAAKAAGLDAVGITALCRGQVWATIVDAAEKEDAQAVVLGSRGHSSIVSALLGSTANGVVHHSSRPVLVVPKAD